MQSFKEPVFFSAKSTWNGKASVIDTCRFDEELGEYVGLYGGKTLEQQRISHGDVEIMEADDAYKLYRAAFITEPKEIDAERFDEMLNVLPPVAWTRANDCESFKLCERTAADITLICVRRGDKFFEFEDAITMTHADIMQKINAKFAR